jgi:DNA-binding MarR family transcriptional regulator
MTNRVDRLVARGFVERHRAVGDRRGVIVRLTDEGRATVDAAPAELLADESELLVELDPAERESLAGLLRRLLRSLEPPPA